MSCEDQISARRNSFEMFGYDLMVDRDCNPWLIEVNSSPSMEKSTPVTEKLVEMVLADTVKLIEKKKTNTGLYKLIYKGDFIPSPVHY